MFVRSLGGGNRLVRHVDNSELPDGWTLSGYGSVSSTAWLALAAESSEEYGWVFSTCSPPIDHRAS